jgi:preprotein translocase subunit SecY
VISVAIQTIQQVKGRLIQQSFLEKKKTRFTEELVSESDSHI